MKVFCDTNVLAAGLASRGGLCADLLARLVRSQAVVISPQVLEELARALPRVGLSAPLVARALALLRADATLVSDAAPSAWPVRDADDARILGSAEAARVDVLVTGDRDLLDVAEGAPVRIVTPRALWDLLNQAGL